MKEQINTDLHHPPCDEIFISTTGTVSKENSTFIDTTIVTTKVKSNTKDSLTDTLVNVNGSVVIESTETFINDEEEKKKKNNVTIKVKEENYDENISNNNRKINRRSIANVHNNQNGNFSNVNVTKLNSTTIEDKEVVVSTIEFNSRVRSKCLEGPKFASLQLKVNLFLLNFFFIAPLTLIIVTVIM